jgi:TolA-binding protein
MRLRHLPVRPLLLIAGSLTAAVSMGCAPNADNQQVQADQFALRGMVANNQQQIDSLQEKIQRLEDRVSELEHNGAASAGGGNQFASIEQRLKKLESQINSTQAGAASAPPPASTNSEASPGESEAAPGSSGEEAPGGEAATAPPNSASAPPAAAANAPSWRAMMDQELTASHDDPGEKLYRAGLVELKANKYSQALSQLQTLQRRYPKSSLSEPAEFFAANALFEMGNYDQAILQFNDQTMRFPKGHFASAALLREAQAFMKINDRIDARLTLQKLLSDLPDSPEAPMAKSMMQTLAS